MNINKNYLQKYSKNFEKKITTKSSSSKNIRKFKNKLMIQKIQDLFVADYPRKKANVCRIINEKLRRSLFAQVQNLQIKNKSSFE